MESEKDMKNETEMKNEEMKSEFFFKKIKTKWNNEKEMKSEMDMWMEISERKCVGENENWCRVCCEKDSSSICLNCSVVGKSFAAWRERTWAL